MSKPVLSELEYNADDVASAILSTADLSIANDDLGVVDRSSYFTFNSSFWDNSEHSINAFSFNGFMFLNFHIEATQTPPAVSNELLYTITDSDFYPTTLFTLPTSSYQGDTANCVRLQTNGEIRVQSSLNESSAAFYLLINGFYRYA